MEQYIPKSIVAAKIEKLAKHEETWMEKQGYTGYHQGLRDAYKSVLSFLKTLEIKDVVLEKEINDYISNNFFGSQTLGFFANRTKEEPNDQDIALCAKHFFELGLKAQKGE